MAFWHRRDKRLKKRAERQARRASRKEARAQRVASRGNHKRAARILKRADKLRQKARRNIFWDHVTVEMKQYMAPDIELQGLKAALDLSKKQAHAVEAYLADLEGQIFSEAVTAWNGSAAGESFGMDPNNRQFNRMLRRARLIANAILRENMFLTLVEGKSYHGKSMPSVLNRPLSANVRMWLNLKKHVLSNGSVNVSELNDTIIHEIAHGFHTLTNHAGDATIRKALRDPGTYAEFFDRFS